MSGVSVWRVRGALTATGFVVVVIVVGVGVATVAAVVTDVFREPVDNDVLLTAVPDRTATRCGELGGFGFNGSSCAGDGSETVATLDFYGNPARDRMNGVKGDFITAFERNHGIRGWIAGFVGGYIRDLLTSGESNQAQTLTDGAIPEETSSYSNSPSTFEAAPLLVGDGLVGEVGSCLGARDGCSLVVSMPFTTTRYVNPSKTHIKLTQLCILLLALLLFQDL